jgi:hypothetical protein
MLRTQLNISAEKNIRLISEELSKTNKLVAYKLNTVPLLSIL